jgi:hypothetical protein
MSSAKLFSLPVIADNQNASLCAPCGGKCCKRAPGKYVPSDFGETRDEIIANVAAALAIGTTALDYYEAHDDRPEIYFPRPAIVGHEGERVHASWGGQCTHLTETGCAMPFVKRPFQCRILQPGAGSQCILPTEYSTTWDIASLWAEYRLERLLDVNP